MSHFTAPKKFFNFEPHNTETVHGGRPKEHLADPNLVFSPGYLVKFLTQHHI